MGKKIAPGEWEVDNPIEGYRYRISGMIAKHDFILNSIVDESWFEVSINSFGGGSFLVKRELLRHVHLKSKVPISESNKGKHLSDILKIDNRYIEWCIDNHNDFHLEEEEIAFLKEIEPNVILSNEALKKNKRRLEQRRWKEEEAQEREISRIEDEFEITKMYGLDDDKNSSSDNPWKEALGDDEEAKDAYWNTE